MKALTVYARDGKEIATWHDADIGSTEHGLILVMRSKDSDTINDRGKLLAAFHPEVFGWVKETGR